MPISVHADVIIEAAAPVAWEFLALYANDPSWRQGVSRMEQTPAGPVVDGATTVEVLRIFGRTLENIAVVSDVRPGRSFRWRVNTGADANGSREVVPIDETHCRVLIVKHVRLSGFDRFLQPLIAWTIRRTERADLERARVLIEKESQVTGRTK